MSGLRSKLMGGVVFFLFACAIVFSFTGCGGSGELDVKKGFYLKMKIYDRTTAPILRPSRNFSVEAKGIRCWTPDLKGGFNQTLIGPLKFDKEEKLFIYPEGIRVKKGAGKLEVKYSANKKMKKASERDAITIEIFDDKISVTGTPVKEGKVDFPR